MASVNPLRYRGYYYDTETGFYYLQSRYYDPVTHRFINADSYATTDSTDPISCNMFAYCGNNPITRRDDTGSWWHVLIAAGISGTTAALSTAVFGGSWADIGDAFVVGNLTGALSACGAEGAALALYVNFLFSYISAIEGGASDNEALGVAAISLVLSAISSDAGDFLVDCFADAVWGFVSDLGSDLASFLATRDKSSETSNAEDNSANSNNKSTSTNKRHWYSPTSQLHVFAKSI